MRERSLKIAQISTPHISTPPKGYGGSELVAGQIAEELTRRGHRVTLFATPDSTARVAELVSFPQVDQVSDFEHRELVHTAYAMQAAGEFDVVHNHCLSAGPALITLSPRPVVSTLHYVHPLVRAFPAHPYVAVSLKQRQLFPELNICAVVHNALDVNLFTFRQKKDDYLLFLGRFHPNKGPHLAIEVAKRLSRRLVLAAPPPPPDQEGYFREKIRPHLSELIDWIGPVEGQRKDDLLGNARCLLAPICWDEPFGLVFLEAMACGTPVITFRLGAAPEVVRHNETGYLVETVEEMVEAVAKLESIDPVACRHHVATNFTIGKMADGYLAVYRRLLRGKQEPTKSTLLQDGCGKLGEDAGRNFDPFFVPSDQRL